MSDAARDGPFTQESSFHITKSSWLHLLLREHDVNNIIFHARNQNLCIKTLLLTLLLLPGVVFFACCTNSTSTESLLLNQSREGSDCVHVSFGSWPTTTFLDFQHHTGMNFNIQQCRQKCASHVPITPFFFSLLSYLLDIFPFFSIHLTAQLSIFPHFSLPAPLSIFTLLTKPFKSLCCLLLPTLCPLSIHHLVSQTTRSIHSHSFWKPVASSALSQSRRSSWVPY